MSHFPAGANLFLSATFNGPHWRKASVVVDSAWCGIQLGCRAGSTPIAVAKSEVEGAGFPVNSLYVTPAEVVAVRLVSILDSLRFRLGRQVGFGGLVQLRCNLLFRLVDQFLPLLDDVFSALPEFPPLLPSVLTPLVHLLRQEFASSLTGFRRKYDTYQRADCQPCEEIAGPDSIFSVMATSDFRRYGKFLAGVDMSAD